MMVFSRPANCPLQLRFQGPLHSWERGYDRLELPEWSIPVFTLEHSLRR